MNANVKRLKAFENAVDARYKVHPDDTKGEDLKELDEAAIELEDESSERST